MFIDHIHFYVENLAQTRDWLMDKMGFQLFRQIKNHHTYTEIFTNNFSIFLVISSPLNNLSPVSNYLKFYASGVVDVAFRVDNIDYILGQSSSHKIIIINKSQTYYFKEGKIKFVKIKGWNSLHHTLVENKTNIPFCALFNPLGEQNLSGLNKKSKTHKIVSNQRKSSEMIQQIDHVVLNVRQGELLEAVNFYETIFNFKCWQNFKIKTNFSGLYSQALIAPKSNFYFNINEPTSVNSQIQTFIDANGGSGIQHLALKSTNIIKVVTEMRNRGLSFFPVSKSYYKILNQKVRNELISSLNIEEWKAIERQQILVDWDKNIPDSILMQIFTKTIFKEPTFFFELIERRNKAQGFGEGNFQALFEIIEKEQLTP